MKKNIVKNLAPVFATLFALTAVTGCSNGAASTGAGQDTSSQSDGGEEAKSTSDGDDSYKVLRFGQALSGDGLDMQRSTSSTSASIADEVTESLLRFNDDNEEEAVLLTDFPEVSEDGTVYSFELKEGVYFTDGTELTSEDVEYTFERMFKPQTGAKSYSYFSMIKGAADMLDGKTEDLEGFEVIDDYHFNITLEYAYAPFIENIGTSYADIFPKEATEAAGENWGVGTNLIGTGPYVIQSNDDVSEVVLVKNTNYHGGEVNLDEIDIIYYDDVTTKLLAYENGEIDLCDLPADLLGQYQEAYADQIHAYYPLGTNFISLNVQNEGLKDVNVRKAISLAINREELVSTILNGAGIPATSFLNNQIPGHSSSNSVYEYDPEAAKALLADSGYADGLVIDAEIRTADQTLYGAIQGYLAEVGITLNLNVVDNATWSADRAAGTINLTGITWNALYADADFQMYTYFYSSNSDGKSVFYHNDEFDKLLDDARSETDADKRASLYEQADSILSLEDYAAIPLYYPQSQFIARDYVKGFSVGNLIYHFWYVDIDQAAKNAE